MLNFGASKPRVGGGPGPRGPPLDPHLSILINLTYIFYYPQRLYDSLLTTVGQELIVLITAQP